MATVFVTQEVNHNFTKAEQFGEIDFITRDDLNNTRNSIHNENLVSEIKHKLRNFNESEDWLVIAGSPYVSALVFMILGQKGVKNLNILRWDNRDYIYTPMYIETRG